MVESLVRFAARSGAAVCAEGIETDELLRVVAELDITYGQGFLFGRPEPAWITPAPDVTSLVAEVVREVMGATSRQGVVQDDVARLERLADRVGEAEGLEQLHRAVAEIAPLVGADDVALDLLDTSRAGQAPGVLVVPVISRAATIGVLSFRRHDPLPWSLNQIRLARIGAGQLAGPLDLLLRHQPLD